MQNYHRDVNAGISSNTLFHFTSSSDHIRSILEDEFRPHFSLEDLSCVEPPEFKLAIPMVCFCDIPLSQTRSHMRHYGSYGIGMSKSWGMENGVSPILYTYQGSPLTANLHYCTGWAFKQYKDLESSPYGSLTKMVLKDEFLQHWQRLLRVVCFLKPYEGILQRPGRPSEKVRFYDEREWRFVPELEGDLLDYILFEDEYNNSTDRSKADQRIEPTRISFEPDDVKYILVSHNDEILPMIELIEKIKGPRYEGNQGNPIKLLSSKIICADNIAEDF